jgi:hypothetical protein
MKIAEALVGQGLITQQQLDTAFFKQKETGEKIDKIVIGVGAIEEQKYLQFLAQQLQISFVDLEHYELDVSLALHLPKNEARLLHAILLAKKIMSM